MNNQQNRAFSSKAAFAAQSGKQEAPLPEEDEWAQSARIAPPRRPLTGVVRGVAAALEAVEAGVQGAIIGASRAVKARTRDTLANKTTHALHEQGEEYYLKARDSASACATRLAARFATLDHTGKQWPQIAAKAATGDLKSYTQGPSMVPHGTIGIPGGEDDASEWTKIMIAADLETDGFLSLSELLQRDRLPGCHWAGALYTGALGIGTRGESQDRQVCLVAHSINGAVPEQRMQGIYKVPNWVAVDKHASQYIKPGTPTGWGHGSDEPFDGSTPMAAYSNSTKTWKTRYIKIDDGPEPGGFINTKAKADMLLFVAMAFASKPQLTDGLNAAANDRQKQVDARAGHQAEAKNGDRGHLNTIGFA